MEVINKFIQALTAIGDPATQMFIAMLATLAVVGFALYVAVLALKRGGKQ